MRSIYSQPTSNLEKKGNMQIFLPSKKTFGVKASV